MVERVFGAAPSVYTNVEKGHSVITGYAYASPRAMREKEAELREGLQALPEFGLDPGASEIRFQKVRREDWSESWKKYFKTIEVGASLMIKPSWSKQKPRKGQAVVVLDPGLSFGTGQHATTSFCLKQAAAKRPKKRGGASLLDIGSGSGILAISAAKLGYAPVDAFDFDPVAVRVALKNCRANRVDARISMRRADLTKLPLSSRKKYDVVCANVVSNLLIAERARIVNRTAPGGTIVLAGILETEFEAVRRAYEAEGWTLEKSVVEREWQSGSFRQKLRP
jgi:ribosomal protein L11 methyltransferase